MFPIVVRVAYPDGSLGGSLGVMTRSEPKVDHVFRLRYKPESENPFGEWVAWEIVSHDPQTDIYTIRRPVMTDTP